MPTAFPNISGQIFHPTQKLIDEGFKASRTSPRKRIILPVHRTQDALVQRMYNFLQPGTYIRPHLHPRPFASESICLLQGELRFFIFDDDGKITSVFPLKAGSLHSSVMDIEPDVWHCFTVHQPDTLIFETKMGPYSTTEDKHFAPWAPDENSPESEIYLQNLIKKSESHV